MSVSSHAPGRDVDRRRTDGRGETAARDTERGEVSSPPISLRSWLNPKSLLRRGKALFKEYKDDDVGGLAAELTYRFFLALFPFLLFLAALGGFIAKAVGVDNPTQRVVNALSGTLPADATSVISTQVDKIVNNPSAGVLSFAIVGALWAASGGAAAFIKAMNRTYDVQETRSFIHRTALALGFTFFGAGGILVAFVLLIGLQFYTMEVANWFGLGDGFALFLAIIRFPVALVLLLLAVATLYWKAPNVKQSFRWISPGAVFFLIVWLIASGAFAFYVANFSSYNATYGALAGVIVLLLWFYITSLSLLLGAELNAVVVQEAEGAALKTETGESAPAASDGSYPADGQPGQDDRHRGAVARPGRAPGPGEDPGAQLQPRQGFAATVLGFGLIAATAAAGFLPFVRRQQQS